MFLFLLKNIDCGYSLEPLDLCFEQNLWKISEFLSEIFHLFGGRLVTFYRKVKFASPYICMGNILKNHFFKMYLRLMAKTFNASLK